MDQESDKPDISNPTLTNINELDIDLAHHIFIAGITQSGKSFFMKRLFDAIKSDGRMCVFLDYKHDPNHKQWIKQHKYPVVKTMKNLKTGYYKWFGLKKGRRFSKVVYQPRRPQGFEGAQKMLNDLSEFVYTRGNTILFVDEVAPLVSGYAIPDSFYDCLIMGASRGVTVIAISQRPKDIHNIIISEAYTKILFRLNLEDDRKKIKGFSSREVADSLQFLPNKQFIIIFADGRYERCQLSGNITPKK